MKIKNLAKSPIRALAFVSVCSGVLALGCELVVDFDRTLIPVPDASLPDGSAVGEGGLPGEGGAGDANPDAPVVVEGGSDAGDVPDAPADAPADG